MNSGTSLRYSPIAGGGHSCAWRGCEPVFEGKVRQAGGTARREGDEVSLPVRVRECSSPLYRLLARCVALPVERGEGRGLSDSIRSRRHPLFPSRTACTRS